MNGFLGRDTICVTESLVRISFIGAGTYKSVLSIMFTRIVMQE